VVLNLIKNLICREIKMSKLRDKIMNFSVKHSKAIMKFVPGSIIKIVENTVVNKMSIKFERVTEFDKDLKNGVNFIGYLKERSGLGAGARLLARAIKLNKYDYSLIDTKFSDNASHDEKEFDNEISKDFSHKINLFHVQPHTNFEVAINDLGIENFKGRYNIGYWTYETENIPKKWYDSFKYVNEIWTPSEFVTNAFKKVAPVPVYTMAYGIETKKNEKLTKKDFDLPEDKFIFLCMYDPKSSVERKNPQAVINAFKQAFKENDDDVFLVIKMNKADKDDIEALKNDLEGIKNYKILTGSFPHEDVYSLISLCDVFISLHRSEGFGLVMAEAMSLGTVCIATNYSANIDFMNKDNSLLVDYKMVKTGLKNHYAFDYNDLWADADVNQAAEYMKMIYKDKELYEKLKLNAEKTIKEEFSIKKSAEKIEKRIDEIVKENNF